MDYGTKVIITPQDYGENITIWRVDHNDSHGILRLIDVLSDREFKKMYPSVWKEYRKHGD